MCLCHRCMHIKSFVVKLRPFFLWQHIPQIFPNSKMSVYIGKSVTVLTSVITFKIALSPRGTWSCSKILSAKVEQEIDGAYLMSKLSEVSIQKLPLSEFYRGSEKSSFPQIRLQMMHMWATLFSDDTGQEQNEVQDDCQSPPWFTADLHCKTYSWPNSNSLVQGPASLFRFGVPFTAELNSIVTK